MMQRKRGHRQGEKEREKETGRQGLRKNKRKKDRKTEREQQWEDNHFCPPHGCWSWRPLGRSNDLTRKLWQRPCYHFQAYRCRSQTCHVSSFTPSLPAANLTLSRSCQPPTEGLTPQGKHSLPLTLSPLSGGLTVKGNH